MTSSAIVLPICTVQHDFGSVVQDVLDGTVPDDKFWVSCYKLEETSVHGKVTVTLDEHDRNKVLFEGHDGVAFKDDGKNAYSVSCPPLDIPDTRLVVASTSFPNAADLLKSTQITAFDVAPDGSQFATGYHDGSVHIRPATSPNAIPSGTSKAHVSTVTSLRFFPSSRVVLTSGADFALSLLSAEPPESSSYTTAKLTPARTLRGHTRAVTSTGIISRGRNVLSGAKDGTVRLWDIPSGAQIRSFAAGTNHFIPVLALSTGERWKEADGATDDGQQPEANADPREVDTSDKVVFCALQDGSFELFDLRTKDGVYRSPAGRPGTRSALQTIAYSPEAGLLATGSASGLVSLYDVRTLGHGPVVSFRRNEAPVEDLAFVKLADAPFSLASSESAEASEVGVAVATEDGLPYVAEVRPSGPRVRAELVGTDCDAVRLVRAVGRDVWTAADDGVVRRYGG
ncbi:WD40 repeat-like protein [Lentinus tigrinus ALCF2SS1-7]|uniref:WD40 repeat-like protein n=1 Tax=Lentinus tigrinus ALCF2SS1-6 TaxID=1328759 RepID=A0A5C2SLA5_9APHY|nr:WD40 repeat-like protein [Lentinus tigrinus ALCF2SS1-6]RPD76631.1 WD40 repeat-like protein [Lentinus tigrinus ALCF2SS1-7]